MTAAVCVFGVDAMDPTLITEWIDSGCLPNLARLRRRSAWGDVLNPPRFFSGASWPSFYTGHAPARHDRYLRTIYDASTCCHEPQRPKLDRESAFWLRDEWRDKRIAVISLPYCPTDDRLNGIQVIDYYSHDHDHKGPGLQAVQRLDDGNDLDAPIVNCYHIDLTASGFSCLRDGLLKRIRQKGETARRIVASEHWDLFVAGIDEGHCAGHRLWHLHDATHPRYQSQMAAKLGDPLKDVYIEIDRAVGAVIDGLDADATILFVSSHGMGPAFDGNVLLEEILRRIEGLEPRFPGDAQARIENLVRWRRATERLPHVLQVALAPLRRRFGRTAFKARRGADARRRKCFWIPTHDLYGGVRINLVGREAHGLVRPGAEYETFVKEVIHELHELRDCRSGERVVAEVVRATDVDPEGYAGERPDLIVHWRQSSFAAIESPKLGRIESVLVDGRSGDHPPTMRGIFFAAGPRIAPGPLSAPVRLEDFAPTISRWFGIELSDSAGSVIADLCTRDGSPVHPNGARSQPTRTATDS